ncbi:heparan-alpha-glucosaminide N-acetyltransferase [Mesorhizobium delmotii]|uniref:Heparan-alpha-glucosaminide N-acetyltransferase catalytic domain-containing protein n=1 Tax=Mesorhizobium delmotii TaxID=1631247 RepID=A0A2P9ARA4_9HYPH|nr:heparan-alpha-glucosaminide N-acetyltransferase [Mesorhizobium delmotii]SJM33692.1 conserved membrane hypothetical protein [Mesorhizobium delmotii]
MGLILKQVEVRKSCHRLSTCLELSWSSRTRNRLVGLDAIRGTAILGVVVFHLIWDLEFAGLVDGIARHPAWLAFGRFLAGTFMALVGVSLVLAHPDGVRWRPFARRLGMIVLSAVAITLVTWLIFPSTFVYFGILHGIAAATLIGCAFLRLPLAAALATGTAMLILPFAVSYSAFDTRWLAWIGFAVDPPASNDYVPVFPWAGLTLVAISATKFLRLHDLLRLVGRPLPRRYAFTALVWMGRHSLAIYLLHQPSSARPDPSPGAEFCVVASVVYRSYFGSGGSTKAQAPHHRPETGGARSRAHG